MEKEDIAKAMFISYMTLALEHARRKYLKNMNRIKEREDELPDDIESYENFESIEEHINFSILNKKENELINLHYNKGYSYSEISNITKENPQTLYKRRNRKTKKGDNRFLWKLNFIIY